MNKSVKKLNCLQDNILARLFLPRQAFSQIYEQQNYDKYKLHDIFLNVLAFINKKQAISRHLQENDMTIGIMIK